MTLYLTPGDIRLTQAAVVSETQHSELDSIVKLFQNFSVNKTAKILRVKMSRAVTVLLLVTFILDPSHAFFWSRLFGSSTPSPSSSPASSPGSRSAELTPSWDSGADSLTWREAQQWCEARGLRSVGEIIINRRNSWHYLQGCECRHGGQGSRGPRITQQVRNGLLLDFRD